MQSATFQQAQCSSGRPSTSGRPFVGSQPNVTSARPRARRLPRCTVARAAPVEEEVPDMTYGFVGQNQAFLRALPLYAGGFGIVSVLLNRAVSGVSAVVDASSSQSRADVLGIIISAVLLLTGLQWLSLKPRQQEAVVLEGEEVMWEDQDTRLPPATANELQWAWSALRACTCCKSLVVILDGRTIFYAGYIRPGVRPGSARAGEVCEAAMKSQQGNYLANLVLYPGRVEFTSFFPENTQGVVVQPIGTRGVLIAGADTIRGVGRLDQAWLAAIADKLEVSLEGVKVAKTGAGFGAAPSKAKA